MTKDDIIVVIYQSKQVIAYCRTICPSEWEELKSQLIIQLVKMKEPKLLTAHQNNYLEYLCFTICKRILYGNVKDSGMFYLNKKHLSLEEGYGADVAVESPTNDYLDKVDEILNTIHWYNKILFNYHYKQGYKLREIAEITGINIKSIAYTISKTRKEIKNKLKEYDDDNNDV